MDATTRASALFIAAVLAFAVLYWLRDVMAPLALAVFLWLVIDGFADAIHTRARFGARQYLPKWASLSIAVVLVLIAAVLTVAVVADSAAEFARKSEGYQARLDAGVAGFYEALKGPLGWEEGPPPTAAELFTSLDMTKFLGDVARAAQGLVSDGILIVIYVAFLFAAEASFPRKIVAIFRDEEDRGRVSATIGSMRASLERFLWVQTWTGAIPAAIAYVVLSLLGLDNALFWAFLIFLVSYVPTIGPIVATILPTMFALVQFDEGWRIAAVFAGVAAPLFVMGNIIQPRVQGETMNLSTIVVLIGLAVWGKLWGIPGMFLSSPLMVALMIVLAQFAETRWIAVLLSADGKPEKGLVQARHAGPKPGM